MVRISGIAWTTPLGDSIDSVWDALLVGKTGLRPVAHEGRLRNELAAPVLEISSEMTPHERLHELAFRAARRALEAAGRDPSDKGMRLVLGTSLGSYLEDAPDDSLYGWAEKVGREIGVSESPLALSTACSSGSDAILLGAELIRSGEADCCICGGADVLTWRKRIGHSSMGTMSPTTLRAFDQRHDGTLLGEGAAFVVLEKGDLTDGRSLAVLRGCGSANDATGMTAADVTGLSARYAVERSLADAGLSADEIGVINAHGSGTQMNDMTEKNCFRETFKGKPGPVVFATKGNFGHSLGATGTMEAIALILALKSGKVPPVAGLQNPDPDFPLPLSGAGGVAHDSRYGLSLTLGFGGFDTSLVFEVPR